jgi:outer membrane protein TolC
LVVRTLAPALALFAVAQAPERPTTTIEPRAQALIADLPPAPELPPPEGPVLPLAEALARARADSPDLKIVRERIVQAQLDVRRAWALIKPTITGNLSYTRSQDPNPIFTLDPAANPPFALLPGNPNSVQGGVTAELPLFNGRAIPTIESAYQTVDVTRLDEAQQRIELLLQVASTYYSGVQLRELALAAFRLTKATRDHAIQAQARFEAGQIQRSAAVRARIDVVRSDEEARRAVYSYLSTKSQVAQLLDRHDTAFELAAPPEPPPEVRGAFSALLERALRDRPELAAARANEEIAARLRTDAILQFFPTLSARGSYNYDNVEDFQGNHLRWAITVSLTLPIYDGGLRYVALNEASSRMRAAKAQTDSLSSRVEDELRRARIDLDSARALREEADQALVYARENDQLVRAQFEAGTATQVEVSDAQAALFQSEATAIQQHLAVQLASLRVAKAVGAFDPGTR